MKSLKSYKCLVFFVFFLCSCGSSKYTVSEYGDKAKLILKNEKELNCEIICFNDSSIIISPLPDNTYHFISQQKQLFFVRYENIDSITIAGFDGKGWGTSVVLFQLIPAGLIAIAASSSNVNPLEVLAVFSVPAIITALFFLASEGETPSFRIDDKYEISDNFKIYSRFPNGLNKSELKFLLERANQKSLPEYN